MDIYLEAVVPGGKLLDIGEYQAPVVPRIGEKILLNLHRLGGEPPYPRSVLFRVRDVRYKANNYMKTEAWMTPFQRGIESESVAVEVSPAGEAAQAYLARLARQGE